ncbi:uncharacterized protein LOC113508120 [Trichoplusia ni]|uniref:Uncharacterized protein LOC113508120 n=1 Tax=Trichoplusia ni TaxID=7111 RepID=A0A7E5X2J6_TRINI|nr:uncharacterized protein LOC113508120 [Trichoplusia ni]
MGGGSAGQSSDEDGLPAPKLPTGRRGRQTSRGASASRPRRDAQGRFVRSSAQAASEAESDVGVTTEDPGGESGASLGSSKAELNAARREQRKAVAADEVSAMAERARERRAALSGRRGRAIRGGPEPAGLGRGGLGPEGRPQTRSRSCRRRTAASVPTWRTPAASRCAERAATATHAAHCRRTGGGPVSRTETGKRSFRRRGRAHSPALHAPVREHGQCPHRGGVSAPPPGNPPSAPSGRRKTEDGGAAEACASPGEAHGGVKKPGEGAPPSAKPTTAGSKGESWATVVGRKKARKAAKADSAAARAPGPTAKAAAQPARRTAKGGRKGPAVRAPRSEAVTLTLQPGAAERGVTYQSVIAEAKAKIKLSDLGLQSVTVRQTVTGARLFEGGRCCERQRRKGGRSGRQNEGGPQPRGRPGLQTGENRRGADHRSGRFRDPEEVVAAVARSGECPRIGCGPATYAPTPPDSAQSGFGAPVASAKKIGLSWRSEGGLGCSEGKTPATPGFEVLPVSGKGARPGQSGTSAADRSGLCYRCGQPGHKAAQCSAALNCCLCSAAGKAGGTQIGRGSLWHAHQHCQKGREEELQACRGNLAAPQAGSSATDSRSGTGCRGNGLSIMAQFHFLQGNINHSARAQDLLLQTMAEWSIDVAVVAEPYFVPARDNWLGCADGLVAIIGGTLIDPSRGRGWSLADFEGFLVELGAVVNRYHPRPVLVLGDLNAKSSAWGSPVTDSRGEALEEWAVTTGLVVLNRGSEYTCVRQRGGSIVDVSFASPSVAGRVRDWRVAVEVETLSDHRYIRFDVSAQTASGRHPTTPINDGPRWALKRIDRELLEEAALVQSWIWESATDGPVDVEAVALWFRGAMTQICDASMPRVSQQSARRRVYWWTDEIARLRVECVAARRRYTRYRRRRRRDPVEEGALYEVYRASKETLWLAIGDSKSRAREELLGSLDRDPWGRPYRWVRGKLRPWAPPVVQGMQPQLLEAVVSALFPERTGHVPPAMASPSATDSPDEESTDVPEVTQEETRAAVSRLRAKNTAPGPDGVPVVLSS